MSDKIVSTVLNVVEDESANADIKEELKLPDEEITQVIAKAKKRKEKISEDSKRNDGRGGFGGNR